MNVLVTGGAGYIGSHVCVQLLRASHNTIIVDNLKNSNRHTIESISLLGGNSTKFYEADITCYEELLRVFRAEDVEAVIHLAGLKSVPKSFIFPAEYYLTNVFGTISLLKAMEASGCSKIIYSSSAAVYAETLERGCREEDVPAPGSPYGHSKLMSEQIIEDMARSSPLQATSLRYFNPMGAHPDGLLGLDPAIANDSIGSCILRCVGNNAETFQVYGADYKTVDGTCLRDYVHVADLAEGHANVLDLASPSFGGLRILNLGLGRAVSVFEVVDMYSEVIGCTIEFEITGRRLGDAAEAYADIARAQETINWRPRYELRDMVTDAWRWHESQSHRRKN